MYYQLSEFYKRDIYLQYAEENSIQYNTRKTYSSHKQLLKQYILIPNSNKKNNFYNYKNRKL